MKVFKREKTRKHLPLLLYPLIRTSYALRERMRPQRDKRTTFGNRYLIKRPVLEL